MDEKRFEEVTDYLAMVAFLAARRHGVHESIASEIKLAVSEAALEIKKAAVSPK